MELPKQMRSPWIRILYRFNHGEDIYKEDILDALESDHPVPYNAKPLLAAIVSGEYKLKRGTARNRKLFSPVNRLRLIEGIEYLERLIKDCDADLSAEDADAVELIEELRAESRAGPGSPTARALAKESIAKAYGISVRTLDGIIGKIATQSK